MKRPVASLLALCLPLFGCAGGEPPADESARAPLLALRSPPEIVASQGLEGDPGRAAERAAAEVAGLLQGARDGRRIEPQAAPFLSSSPAGRRFLAASPPGRALARGAPEAFCPAVATAAPRAGGPEAAARMAFEACLAQLRERGAPAACGCRLLAVGDVLTAPIEAFAFAPGVGARLLGAGGTGGRPLVAEQRVDAGDPDALLVAFRDISGAVAEARLSPDGAASLTLRDGARFEGRRELQGWRRGRLVERLLLRGPDGARLIALIGFEPADIAGDGSALAAWPGGPEDG